MASIVWGTPDDLINLFGKPEVDDAIGTYESPADAFAQTAAEVPDVESDGKFRLPADAGDLWSGVREMGAESQARVWNALGAYANAWRLKAQTSEPKSRVAGYRH